jgi:RNA polymerase sigma-70 factor (ECF subfamily)
MPIKKFLEKYPQQPHTGSFDDKIDQLFPRKAAVTPATTTMRLQSCLERVRGGDATAADELLLYSQNRLRKLTAKMLARLPAVHRWEDTDDVLQQVLMRMDNLLGQLEVIGIQDYFHLAAANIRRVLIDLIRRYKGLQSMAGPETKPTMADSAGAAVGEVADPASVSRDALTLDDWSDFHETANGLPEEDRQAFDLLWYHELKQNEAAEVLGISLSTLKRRWQSARVKLTEKLGSRLKK